MEERVGDSFDDVQIRADPRAAEAAEQLNARAFTVGNHIVFNHGEYDPESAEGQHVLAHELAHVRQQTGGALSMLPQEDLALEIDPDSELEREAEETAERVVSGGELNIRRMQNTDIHLQRWEDQPRRDNGEFGEKDADQAYDEDKPYADSRPKYAPGQVEEVWRRAKQEGDDDIVEDPNTGQLLTWDRSRDRTEQWHMGHKPDREYQYLHRYYMLGIITKDEFIEEYQNPDHYRPEAPIPNQSQKYEGDGEYWENKWGEIEEYTDD